MNDESIIPLGVILNTILTIQFILCELGVMMTKHFEIFCEKYAQCPWYSMPIDMQRMYMIFLATTQSPISMTSYGGITCERDTSKKVEMNTFEFRYFSIFFLILVFR